MKMSLTRGPRSAGGTFESNADIFSHPTFSFIVRSSNPRIGAAESRVRRCFWIIPGENNVPTRPRRDVLIETAPGEEAQVDYGTGPMVRDPLSSKYRRTRLFVLTLGYSRKSVRLIVFRSSSQIWAELHEKAFRRLCGVTRVVVLDNLREGVLKPDVYDPRSTRSTGMCCSITAPFRLRVASQTRIERIMLHTAPLPLDSRILRRSDASLTPTRPFWASRNPATRKGTRLCHCSGVPATTRGHASP